MPSGMKIFPLAFTNVQAGNIMMAMNVLLVYPKYPETFWSFKYALKFISKKASFPPLGLITVASLLPEDWNVRLLDLNVRDLADSDLDWADMVMISAMRVQKKSVDQVVERCRQKGIKVVGGGPLFTIDYEEFPHVDHLVLGEGELTLPRFLEDLRKGKAKHLYFPEGFAPIEETPVPAFNLAELKRYASMNVQYSRGCPYNCEFCDIPLLYGRIPRVKKPEQVLGELEELYRLGWRGGVFFVDDNFIGNRKKLKGEFLPALIDWMKAHRYPFSFFTEASVNLADDEELMELMVRAGFNRVFVGIESPEPESLEECKKFQNVRRDLLKSVEKIQNFGLEVQGGFIVGFDHDKPSTFKSQVEFIRKSKIITAMVGLLNAPKGTRLYKRLMEEGRIISNITGDNTDFSLNFIPRMGAERLIKGYKWVLKSLYSPTEYYKRVKEFLRTYTPPKKRITYIRWDHLKAFFRSIWLLGLKEKERSYYWKLLFWTLLRRPRLVPMAVTFTIYGYHFRKIYEKYWQT